MTYNFSTLFAQGRQKLPDGLIADLFHRKGSSTIVIRYKRYGVPSAHQIDAMFKAIKAQGHKVAGWKIEKGLTLMEIKPC